MPKLSLPTEHPLLIKHDGKILDYNGIKAFMDQHGEERENKPYIGVDKEANGDEYLIVGYFQGLAEQRAINFRKINAIDFEIYFANDLDSVTAQLVNLVFIGIGVIKKSDITKKIVTP